MKPSRILQRLTNSRTLAALAVVVLCAAGTVRAQSPASPPQGETWTLGQCIDYALKHNITVRQSAMQVQQNELQYNTARNSRLPAVSATLGGNVSFGQSTYRDPSTDIQVTKNSSLFSSNAGISTSVPIFNGMAINSNIDNARLSFLASQSDRKAAEEDVELAVTAAYVQVLFNRALREVAQTQVDISDKLVNVNSIKFERGKIPEADVVESRAQLARDRYSLVQQQNALDLAVLDLKQYLNMEASVALQVAIPDTDNLRIAAMNHSESIEEVYNYAVGARPAVQAENFRLEAAQAGIRGAKSQLYPQISLGAGYNNSFSHSFSGLKYGSFSDQLRNNGGEYVGLNISIPIFNRLETRNRIRSANVSSSLQELTLERTKQDLRKTIEQAYYKARSGYEQYVSSKEAADAARKSFGYEEQRQAAGVSTLYDYDLSKSRLEKAEADMVQAKYEFIFRSKVLKYYLGETLDFDY